MHSFAAQPSIDFDILLRETRAEFGNLRYTAFDKLLATSTYVYPVRKIGGVSISTDLVEHRRCCAWLDDAPG